MRRRTSRALCGTALVRTRKVLEAGRASRCNRDSCFSRRPKGAKAHVRLPRGVPHLGLPRALLALQRVDVLVPALVAGVEHELVDAEDLDAPGAGLATASTIATGLVYVSILSASTTRDLMSPR